MIFERDPGDWVDEQLADIEELRRARGSASRRGPERARPRSLAGCELLRPSPGGGGGGAGEGAVGSALEQGAEMAREMGVGATAEAGGGGDAARLRRLGGHGGPRPPRPLRLS